MSDNDRDRERRNEGSARAALVVAALLAVGAVIAMGMVQAERPGLSPELLRLAGELRVQWVGRPAPDFDIASLRGGRLRKADLEGRPALVHFWASWCPTCQHEWPALRALQQRLRQSGIRVVHVSLDESMEDARAALPGGGLEGALDPDGALANRFGTEKLPEAYLLDRKGRVLLRFVAAQPWAEPRMIQLIEGAVAR